MKINPFKSLSLTEKILWSISMLAIAISFLSVKEKDYLNLATSLVGATLLIFEAKGNVLGQTLTIVFAIFYAIVAYKFRYFGEMATYLGMALPSAVLATGSWLAHPFRDISEVTVNKIKAKAVLAVFIISTGLTIAFYFILKALNTPNLIVSTISIFTSAIAACLTILRSPYYAIAYATNDVVLIVLWSLAFITNHAYLPMLVCFLVFLANDLYGFVNWTRLAHKQAKIKKEEQNTLEESTNLNI